MSSKFMSSSDPRPETLLWRQSIYFDFDILSGIFSDILSGIFSGIQSGIYSDILYGILSDILSAVWLRSGSAH